MLRASGDLRGARAQASSDCTLCVAVPRAQCAVAVSALRAAFQLELRRSQNSISVTSGMSITAIFQNGMAWRPGVSAVLMRAMAAAGISIRAIAQGSSERQVRAVSFPFLLVFLFFLCLDRGMTGVRWPSRCPLWWTLARAPLL